MKTKTLIAAMLLLTGLSKAQITLEHSHKAVALYGSMYIVNLSVSGAKYAYTTQTNLKLYNLDHSLWKTISLPTQPGYSIYGAWNISEGLFNTDGAVEVAYTTSLYNYTSTPASYKHEGRVVSDNGTNLITIPNCVSMQIQNTVTNGWKLIATIDSTNKMSNSFYDVYSLTGSMPTALKENNPLNPVSMSSPMPNPSQNKTTIAYTLSDGVSSAEIMIYDINGKEVKRFTVDGAFNTLELDNTDLPSGTYLYQMNGHASAKKMVIVK